jgi:hypothetical protein
MSATNHLQVFNLSLRRSYLIAVIGSALSFTVLALTVICIALMRAIRRRP